MDIQLFITDTILNTKQLNSEIWLVSALLLLFIVGFFNPKPQIYIGLVISVLLVNILIQFMPWTV